MSKAILIILSSVAVVSSLIAADMKHIELLKVQADSLKQLEYKVSNRNDIVRQDVHDTLYRYLIQGRFETYYFTRPTHKAHPTAVFRGRVERADGTQGFDQRAWSASTNEDALSELLISLESIGVDSL